jgi:hypothetical protein
VTGEGEGTHCRRERRRKRDREGEGQFRREAEEEIRAHCRLGGRPTIITGSASLEDRGWEQGKRQRGGEKEVGRKESQRTGIMKYR